MCKSIQSSAFFGRQKMVRNPVHSAFLNNINGNVVPMRSGCISSFITPYRQLKNAYYTHAHTHWTQYILYKQEMQKRKTWQ